MTIQLKNPKLPVIWYSENGVSMAEFIEFCKENPELQVERDSKRNLIVMAPVGFSGGAKEIKMMAALENWSEQNQLGVVTSSNGAFLLPSGAIRVPDAAWTSQKKIDANTKEERENFFHGCPEFVAEIRSKSDSLKALKLKMEEWIESGCKLAFLIDPIKKNAWVYKPNREPEFHSDLEGKLSGEDVLPGFELALSKFDD